MNCINPRSIVAFSLILFVTLIVCGTLLAQDRSKPLDPKAMRLQMSVPEIKLTTVILALGQVEFCFHNGNWKGERQVGWKWDKDGSVTKTASFSCVEYKGVIEVRKHEK